MLTVDYTVVKITLPFKTKVILRNFNKIVFIMKVKAAKPYGVNALKRDKTPAVS